MTGHNQFLHHRIIWCFVSAALVAIVAVTLAGGGATPTSAAAPPPTQQGQALPPGEQQPLPTGSDLLRFPLRGLPSDAFAMGLSDGGSDSRAQGGECATIDPTENVGALNNAFWDIDMTSDNDGWAVGAYSTTTETTRDAMIQRWSGSEWNLVPDPDLGANNNYLLGVSVISANDVWAVGAVRVSGRLETLVEHWNGTAWSRVASPNPGSGDNGLLRVDGDASNNVWAVGYYVQSSLRTLVMRWDGTAWSVVPSANPGGLINFLNGVEVVPSVSQGNKSRAGGSSEVWAVGYYLSSSFFAQTLTQRFDGTQFVTVPSPNMNTSDNLLFGIDSLSPTDIWAAGHYYNGSLFQTLIMHWDGTAWSVEPSANAPGNNYLFDIAMHDTGLGTDAHGPQQGIAVGGYQVSTIRKPLVIARNDGPWGHLSWAFNLDRIGELSGADLVAATIIYYLGGQVEIPRDELSGGSASTMAARLPGSCVLATPTPGGATPTATFTPGPPTSTPTPCAPGQFSDVPPGSTFYDYVTCLVNEEIISGYPDCTFRPNNNVTRGQIAKIVSNAAAFTDPVSGQTFEDVPTGSTFYDFVERLVLHDVMSGYACGGPGEPCVPPTNRPYFRSNGSTTRGQMTKIVSNAAAFTDPIPAGTQTFTDVPEGSTFHLFVERLLLNRPGAMNGYPCGNPGEPCDGQNRPYFRPANTLTRGQASKIVANTFFPGCTAR